MSKRNTKKKKRVPNTSKETQHVVTRVGEKIDLLPAKHQPIRIAFLVCCNPACISLRDVVASPGPLNAQAVKTKCHKCGFICCCTEDRELHRHALRLNGIMEAHTGGPSTPKEPIVGGIATGLVTPAPDTHGGRQDGEAAD